MKTRLTFLTNGSDSFFKDWIPYLKEDFEVKLWKHDTQDACFQMLHDTDIAWFEWCDEFAIQVLRSAKFCKYVVRLHSYEFFTPMPSHIDWSKVDRLMFVSPTLLEFANRKFPDLSKTVCQAIPNGVDIIKHTIPEDKSYNKKVAFVGYMNYKKGPQLLLNCFQAIYDYDPTFEFYIAGEHQDERIHLWFSGLQNLLPFTINWDGWQENMPDYLKDKDFVINTSLFESQCLSLQEGMASGVIPLVHAWLGADRIYPMTNIFVTPDQCVDIIKNFEKENNKDRVRRSMRKHIVEDYNLEKQTHKVIKMLKGL